MKDAGDGAPDLARTDWSRARLDGLDLLLIVGFSTLVLVAFRRMGWQPRGIVVGGTLAPMLVGLLSLRRRWLPPAERRDVAKPLSVRGLLALLLMTAGLIVGLFGAFSLVQRTEVSKPIDEAVVRERAELRARVASAAVTEVSPDVQVAPVAFDDAERGVAEALASLNQGPTEADIAREEADVRRELALEAEAGARAQRDAATAFAVKVAGLAIGLLGLGAWLDARRTTPAR